MQEIKKTEKKLQKRFSYVLLAEYLLFSVLLLTKTHSVNSVHSGYNLSPYTTAIVSLGMVSCCALFIGDRISNRIRNNFIIIYSFLQLLLCGLSERLFITDYPLLLAVFLMSIIKTEELGLIFIGVLEYFLLFLYYAYKQSTLVHDLYTFIPSAVILSVFVYSWIYIVSRRQHINSYKNTLERYRLKGIESEEYLFNISHELRTKVNTISGVMEISREAPEYGEMLNKLQFTKNSILGLSSNIDNIMDFSEISSARFSGGSYDYSFSHMIQGVMDISSMFNNGRGIELYFDISPDIPATLTGDCGKIRNMLIRTLEDAIRYTPRGGVYFTASARTESYGCNLHFTIENTGAPASDIVSDRIFGYDEHIDLDVEPISLQELNLLLVKKLAEAMGGFIRINRTENNTRLVTITLPQGVKTSAPWLKVDDNSPVSALLYIKQDKFETSVMRAMGNRFMAHAFEYLKLAPDYAATPHDFDRMLSERKYTHIFISVYEYLSDSQKFDRLAREGNLIVIKALEDEMLPPGDVKILSIPFAVHDLHRLFWGSSVKHTGTKYSKAFKKLKALVAGHDPVNLIVVSDMLKIMGAEVEESRTRADVLDACMQDSFDLIIWNYSLPDMDIEDLAENIHTFAESQNTGTPIIGITAMVHSSIRQEMEEKGFSAYLPMPVTMGDLYSCIGELLPGSTRYSDLDEADDPAPVKTPSETPDDVISHESGDNQGTDRSLLSGLTEHKKVPILVTGESVGDIPAAQSQAEGIPIISYYIQTKEGYRFSELDEACSDFLLNSAYYQEGGVRSIPPTVEDYTKFFKENLKKADEIIHISMMDFKDSGLRNARESAMRLPGVHVVDSGSVSMGHGKMILAAAKAARAGFGKTQIMDVLNALQRRMSVQFLVTKTDVSRFNGFFLSGALKLCNFLRIYPVISIQNGRFVFKEILRGSREDIYRDFIYSAFREYNVSSDFLLLGTSGLDHVQTSQLLNETARYMRFADITSYKIRSATSCITGRGSMGIGYFIDEESMKPGKKFNIF